MRSNEEEGPPQPIERKNSIGLMEALLAPVPPPQLQQTSTTTNTTAGWQQHTTVSCKQEEPDYINDSMMTLEDFLALSEAPLNVDEDDVKFPPPPPDNTLLSGSGRMLSFDNNPSPDHVNDARGKRRPFLADPSQDKAAQQRQRRMIKNRESAARSRERKQAYQAELESLALKLEEENEMLIKAKEEQTRKRYKQLMDNIIPVTEKRRPTRYVLKKVRSMEW